ncbi:hypothetical protein PSPO01_01690 [Paraphaeosphaeria sporulosa]
MRLRCSPAISTQVHDVLCISPTWTHPAPILGRSKPVYEHQHQKNIFRLHATSPRSHPNLPRTGTPNRAQIWRICTAKADSALRGTCAAGNWAVPEASDFAKTWQEFQIEHAYTQARDV